MSCAHIFRSEVFDAYTRLRPVYSAGLRGHERGPAARAQSSAQRPQFFCNRGEGISSCNLGRITRTGAHWKPKWPHTQLCRVVCNIRSIIVLGWSSPDSKHLGSHDKLVHWECRATTFSGPAIFCRNGNFGVQPTGTPHGIIIPTSGLG